MIVADSSFVVDGLLRKPELLADDLIVSPDFMLYEVTNAIWKHVSLLKDLERGDLHLSVLYGLVEAGRILALQPNLLILQRSLQVAIRNKVTIYDAIFVVTALELGLELRTLDETQERILKAESKGA